MSRIYEESATGQWFYGIELAVRSAMRAGASELLWTRVDNLPQRRGRPESCHRREASEIDLAASLTFVDCEAGDVGQTPSVSAVGFGRPRRSAGRAGSAACAFARSFVMRASGWVRDVAGRSTGAEPGEVAWRSEWCRRGSLIECWSAAESATWIFNNTGEPKVYVQVWWASFVWRADPCLVCAASPPSNVRTSLFILLFKADSRPRLR